MNITSVITTESGCIYDAILDPQTLYVIDLAVSPDSPTTEQEPNCSDDGCQTCEVTKDFDCETRLDVAFCPSLQVDQTIHLKFGGLCTFPPNIQYIC